MGKKSKKTCNGALLFKAHKVNNHVPFCFGQYVDCIGCYYNKSDACEFQSWVNSGHTIECAVSMVTGDRTCICGKQDDCWMTDKEYSPELLDMAIKLKEAGKLRKWLSHEESVEFCREQGITVPPEIAGERERQISFMRIHASIMYAMLTVFEEFIEVDNPNVSFLEVHKKAIKLVEDMDGNVPLPEQFAEMLKENFGVTVQ